MSPAEQAQALRIPVNLYREIAAVYETNLFVRLLQTIFFNNPILILIRL